MAGATPAPPTPAPARRPAHGMIVTSTGLLFATAKDGNVRAYDAETGAVPGPARCRAARRHPGDDEDRRPPALVVCATTGLTWGGAREGGLDPGRRRAERPERLRRRAPAPVRAASAAAR
jgi:hypothetical protein